MLSVRGLPVLLALLAPLSGCGSKSQAHLLPGSQSAPPPGSGNSQPADPPENCAVAGIQTINLPYYSDQTGSPTFPYMFEYVAPTLAGAPTLVFISGGPGQTAISQDSDWQTNLPPGFGYLLTDPRGVGCNAKADGSDYPAAFYKSRYVADDIDAAIQHVGLTNYLIYGISYGTEVATIAGSKAEAGAVAVPPKAVILEGTLGRAMTGNEADATYESLWAARIAASPPLAQAFAATTLPLGKSANDWLSVLRLLLEFGQISENGAPDDVLGKLLTLATSTDPADQSKAASVFDSLNQSSGAVLSPKGADSFYVYIACQEIWSALATPTLVAGVMTDTASNACASVGLSLGPEKYDAANWPIKAPIYYFDGQNDPATPIALAHYHFQVETTSPARQMTVVAAGGHNPLELSLTPCLHSVWEAIGSDTPLAAALDTCNWTPGVTLISVGAGGGESPQAITQAGP